MAYNVSDLQSYASSQEEAQGLPSGLLSSLITTESNWNPSAVGAKGEIGIAQIMPGTAAGNVDATDPFASIQWAAKTLASYFREFGSWDSALAAYNAGPGAVRKYGGVPPYQTTQNYVQKILSGLGIGADTTRGTTGGTVGSASVKVLIWLAAIILVIYGFRAVLK